MKSIQTHTSRKKITLITAAILLLIAAGAGGYFVMANGNKQQDVKEAETTSETNLDPATSEQIEAGNSVKETTVENDGKPNSGGSDKPPEVGAAIGVSIPSANQNGNVVNIRALISELIGSGNCSLKLTKGTSVVLKTAAVQAMSSTATCQGFDVPTSELSAGNWHLTLTVTSGDRTGTAEYDMSIQ